MLKKLKAFFEHNENNSKPQESDIQLAAASLMFEMIRSDGNVDDVEIEQLRRILSEHFSLNEDDVEALILDAQSSAEDAISLQGFTRAICDNWDNNKRAQLIEYLWILALADEKIDAHERHLVRKVAGLLYMTDQQINIAREAAKQKLQITS